MNRAVSAFSELVFALLCINSQIYFFTSSLILNYFSLGVSGAAMVYIDFDYLGLTTKTLKNMWKKHYWDRGIALSPEWATIPAGSGWAGQPISRQYYISEKSATK